MRRSTPLYTAQPDIEVDPAALTAARVIEECDQKLARHRAALEAGADPHLVASWMAEVQARRAEALARSHTVAGSRRMSSGEIRELVEALGEIRHVLAEADPEDKAEVYRQLGLRLAYQPGKRTVRAEVILDSHSWGYGTCPRGELLTIHTPLANVTLSSSSVSGKIDLAPDQAFTLFSAGPRSLVPPRWDGFERVVARSCRLNIAS